VQELQSELGRFMSGQITADELAAAFHEYLESHPERRAAALGWLQDSARTGRVSESLTARLLTALPTIPSAGEIAATPRKRKPRATPAAPAPAPAPAAAAAAAPALAPATVAPPAAAPATSGEATVRRAATKASGDATVRRAAKQAAPPPAADPPVGGPGTLGVGAVLKGRFVLVAELGRGGMGSVYKALDRRKEEMQDRQPYVALKLLSEDFARHPDSIIALQREAKRAQTLAHPNVSTVYDFDRDGSHVFMTMELLDGRTLDSLVAAEGHAGLTLEQAWPLIRGMAAALQYGHQKGIVHSDFKPGNVFVTRDGTVKLLDFGISRPMPRPDSGEAETLFDPGKRLGGLTPAYASLEMWLGQPPDPRDDIYAFGCTVHELLTGRHPFGRASAKQAFESGMVPQRIESLTRRQWETLRRAMALSRADRIPSIAAFLDGFAPRGLLRRYAVPLAVGGGVVFLAALFLGGRFYGTWVEDRMIGELPVAGDGTGAPVAVGGPAEPLTDEERAKHAADLSLAAQFMMDAEQAVGDPDALAAVLSEGANSVNDIVAAVLARDPANAEARGLQTRTVDLYWRAASAQLEQGNARAALTLTRHGLKIAPRNTGMFRLQRQICEASPGLCEQR
jgi:predicted Ser/Thr protein kinase